MAEDFTKHLEQLHVRMNALLATHSHGPERGVEAEDRAFAYAGLDDNREDRAEYRDAQEVLQLRDRLEALEQSRGQDRSQREEMSY